MFSIGIFSSMLPFLSLGIVYLFFFGTCCLKGDMPGYPDEGDLEISVQETTQSLFTDASTCLYSAMASAKITDTESYRPPYPLPVLLDPPLPEKVHITATYLENCIITRPPPCAAA